MRSVGPSRIYVLALIFLGFLSPVVAQPPATKQSAAPQPSQKASADNKSYFRRCVEELDLSTCAHAEKLPLSTQEKSQVFTFECVAQPLCEDKTLLEKAIQLDPQNALAYFLRASYGQASADEVVKTYRKAIELNPEWKRYYVDAALVANGAESYKSSDEGLKLWQVALASAPDDPRAYTGYASALRSRGKNAEAEKILKKGSALNATDAEAAYGLCTLYITQKDTARLRPVCETAIAGLSSEVLGTLGYALSEIKEYGLAESAYRKAVERGPDPGNVLESNLANTLLQEGKASEAAEIYRRTLARGSDDPWSDREQYAAALETAGDLKNAEAQYLQAAKHNDCDTLGALGSFYLRQKRVQEALEQFDRAFQDTWDCSTPVYLLTQGAQAFGTERKEIPPFEAKILARAQPKPDEKVANTWYRFANLAHAFGHNDDAAAAYRKAADLDPKQAFPLGGLGWALCDAGRYREAVAAFEEAEKRQPGYLKSAPEVQKRYEQSLAAVQGKKP